MNRQGAIAPLRRPPAVLVDEDDVEDIDDVQEVHNASEQNYYSNGDTVTSCADRIKQQLPVPLPVALHQSVNPTSPLLFSFPVPQINGGVALQNLDSDESFMFNEKEVKAYISKMVSTATPLMASPTYGMFFTEAIQTEEAAMDTEDEQDSTSSTAKAAEKISKHFHHIIKTGGSSGLSPPPSQPLAHPSPRTSTGSGTTSKTVKKESHWVPQAPAPMTLRPRIAPGVVKREKEEEEEPVEKKVPLKRVKKEVVSSSTPEPTRRKETRVSPRKTSAQTEALQSSNSNPPNPHLETYGQDVVTDVIHSGNLSSDVLHDMITVFALDSGSVLKGVESSARTKFVAALLEAVSAEEVRKEEDHWARAVRGLACLSILADPQFPAASAPEKAMDQLVTVLSSLVHRIGQLYNRATREGEGEGKPLKGTKQGATSGSLISWLELLRQYLQSFVIVISNRQVHLVTDSDTFRLEDVCFKCLFIVSHRCSPAQATQYASYTMESAIRLYRCVWNRLEIQRHITSESFFSRLLLSDNLLLRCYRVQKKELMPLTVAVLAAAQSTPVYLDTVNDVNVSRLVKQSTIWATSMLHCLLLDVARVERNDGVIARTAVVQFAEDLTDLLGSPEWPAADLLLRSLIHSLRHTSTTTGVEGGRTLTNAQLEAVRSASVDVFGAVALKLCPLVNLQYSSETDVLRDITAQLQLVAVDSMVLEHWKKALALDRPAIADQKKHSSTKKKRVKKEEEEEVEEERELSPRQLLAGLIYYTLSKKVERSKMSEAFNWFYTRAANVLLWRELGGDALLTEDCLDGLVRDTVTPCGQLPDSGEEELQRWVYLLSASEKKSALSPSMCHMLITFILSVFNQVEGEDGAVASDAVLKKALAHLTKLLTLLPALSRFTWPLVRSSIQGDSAKVRESIAPLLITLLKGILQTYETDADSQLVLTSADQNTVTDMVSCLLHLLEDKRATVISRAVSTIDTLLTDAAFQPLLDTTQGTTLRGFAQHKLLGLCKSGGKLTTDITKHFLHRWLAVVAQDDGVTAVSHPLMVSELFSLAILGAGEFPYEVNDSHALVHLLKAMLAQCSIKSKNGVDEAQLRSVMRGVAKSLWRNAQHPRSAQEAVGSMVALRILTLVSPCWVEPLEEALLQALDPQTTSGKSEEESGGVLLQATHIMGALLSSSVPVLSLDHISKALSSLLSNYVGPFQQRILIAACGALTAMITCGAKDKLSLAQIRPPYLVLCYNHMNSYYVRARELLPSLRSQPQGSAYLQRYLFLLSELLRLYHNWSKPHAILLEANITGKVPNELSAGGGICENVYQLMLQILSVCEADVKAKLAVITLKMFTSLCILQPSKFWPLCEPHIREALQPSAAVSLQVQGLTFIRDFLAEEDARVDLAAKLTADVETGKQIAQAERVSEEDGEEEEESEEEEYKAYRGKKKKTAALPSHDEDQNSGMATWVMQKFYQDIIQLCETSRWVLVRRRCLEVLQWSAQCGLLPPVKYLDVLIGLCGDVDPSLRPIALRCLRSLADRHEDAIASLFSRGLLKAYGVQHLCQVNLLQSAYVTDSMGLERSVYSPVIKLLHKKGRDNSMTSLLRLLYQESKARALWEDLGEDAAEEDVFRSKNPATLLAHIGTVIALTPFVLESDVLHVLQLCGEGIDYNGANMSDLLTQELNGGSQKLHTVTLHLSIGVVMLHYIQQTLKMEYRLGGAKIQRLMTGGHGGATTVHGRTAGSPVIQKFLLALAQLVKTVAPLFTPTKTSRERSKSGRSKSQPHTQALEFLKTEIETALLEGVHEIMAKPRKAGRKAAPKKSSRRRVKASETPSTDSAFSSGSDSDDDESSEDDY